MRYFFLVIGGKIYKEIKSNNLTSLSNCIPMICSLQKRVQRSGTQLWKPVYKGQLPFAFLVESAYEPIAHLNFKQKIFLCLEVRSAFLKPF